MNSENEITISDFSKCIPTEKLSRDHRSGCWQMHDYKTEDGIQGTLIYACPEDQVGEISLPLNVSGLYDIHVGINFPRAALGDILHYTQWPLYGTVWMKLSSDNGFSRFALESPWRQDRTNKVGQGAQIWHSVYETYWKSAQLDGESITISPPKAPYNSCEYRQIANVTYIRLTKPSQERKALLQKLDKPEKKLAVQYCAAELSGHTAGSDAYHPTDKQWFVDAFEPFRNNDVGIVCFEAIRGNLCLFKSDTADCGTPDNRWPDDWVDPLEAVVQVGKENGFEVFCGTRMIGAGQPPVRNPIQWAKYYWTNQKWSKRDPQGRPGSNLSIAFPEVRQYWLKLMRQALDKGCTGIHLLFDRSWPFVCYEKPSLDAFEAKYHLDARQVKDDDPRWIEHQGSFVNQFLREIRQLIDEKPDQKLAVHTLCANYGGWELQEPRSRGCDVDYWIREKLVDYVMPTPAGGEAVCGLIQRWKNIDGCQTKIYPDLFPRTQPAENYAKLAKLYYAAGADGMIFRDCERRCPRSSEWAVAARLGHKNQLDELGKAGKTYFRRTELDEIDGLSVKYSFNDG